MEKQSHNLNKIILLTVITLLFCCFASTAFAAPTRVAILPFDVNAEKDLTFLQEGIVDMLASRIAWRDRVDVIDKNETRSALDQVDNFEGESKALLVGGKLHADYVLFGSLTVLGDSVSIDAKMVDVDGKQPPMPFFAQTSTMDGIIPQINQFATDINQTVFGRGVARRPTEKPAVQPGVVAVPAVPVLTPTPGYDPHMHPEKLLESDATATAQSPAGTTGQNPVPDTKGTDYQPPNPAFVVTAPAGGTADRSQTFWKSRNFKALITGIGIADVDQDGQKEVVVLTEKMVSIYRMTQGRLVKSAEMAETRSSTYVSVDIFDINGNGTPELYITSLGPGKKTVDSFVLEYDGADFTTISKNNNLYFRVQQTVDRGTILLGQKQRTADESIFQGAIREVKWQGDRLVEGRQLLSGGKANLLGLVYGDITHIGQSTIAAYSAWDRIRVYNPGGEKIWEDRDRTGGNATSFNLPKVEPGHENIQFFPLRLRTVDLDRDGRLEILRARHDELANNMLKNFRSFSKAQVESVVWDKMGLISQWKTLEFEGRASDFVAGDYDNDGLDELIIAVVSKEGSIAFTDAVSSIVAFDLGQ